MLFLFKSYNVLLIAAAIIPAVLLLIRIYRSDRLDKEPPRLILSLLLFGLLSTFIASLGERLGVFLLKFLPLTDTQYALLLYFVVVAGCEEGSKYLFLKKRTWFSADFNCHYDAVLYATAVSLGFALWENLNYVFSYGLGTALVRAVTAVPGHCCFGVFMGFWYGLAKKADNFGYPGQSLKYRLLAFAVPLLLHGAYDFIATQGGGGLTLGFLVFVGLLFFISFRLVRRLSDRDQYIV